MVDKALVQINHILVNTSIQFAVRGCLHKMHFGQHLVEFLHRTVTGEHIHQELHGVDASDNRIGKRFANGRTVVILAHDGQIHLLWLGNGDTCTHVVQQVHVEEQMSGEGRNQAQRLLVIRRLANAGNAAHIAHAIVDGFYRSGEGQRRDSTR